MLRSPAPELTKWQCAVSWNNEPLSSLQRYPQTNGVNWRRTSCVGRPRSLLEGKDLPRNRRIRLRTALEKHMQRGIGFRMASSDNTDATTDFDAALALSRF